MSLPAKPIDTLRPKWVPPSAYDPLPVLAVYLLVLAASILSALDAYLPVHSASSVIEEVSEQGSRQGRGWGRNNAMRYWSSIDLVNGKNIWTQRTANNFSVGDSMDVTLSAVFGKVVGYRSHRLNYGSWYATEGVNEKYRPLPFVVIFCVLLLFYPGWSTENRMLLRGVLFVSLAAWLIVLIATHG